MANMLQRLSQMRILPPAITGTTMLTELIEQNLLSYNGGRLREAARVFTEKCLTDDCTVGMSVAGALTPAGLGLSCLIPLIEAGFVDWIVSTGANLYHDTHFALNIPLYQGRPGMNDRQLRENAIIRIYDVIFDSSTLYDTDAFYRQLCRGAEFQRPMSSATFHYLVGKYLHENARQQGGEPPRSLLLAAYRAGVPLFTSSPGDSSIGMNIAALALEGCKLRIDPMMCVNETAAVVYAAKRQGTSAVVIWGGGSPKNFVLQTEPHIQEVLGLADSGHDYFLQFTDARPDTGGLSGATPSEAMTWGKVNPDTLPDTVTCYVDSTVTMPLLTAYALAKHSPRTPRRLMDCLEALVNDLSQQYLANAARKRPAETLGQMGPAAHD